jgi:hypothetical protein
MCLRILLVNFNSDKGILLRRYATVLLLAMWMGGFTFYALVVIPTATKVLGSIRLAGFITQQVTNWLNLIGVAVILFFLWNVTAEWNQQTRVRRMCLAGMWGVMALTHSGLFIVHRFIDHQLTIPSHTIGDYDGFLTLHTVYLFIATTQWVAALIYLWLLFGCWRRSDMEGRVGLRVLDEMARVEV